MIITMLVSQTRLMRVTFKMQLLVFYLFSYFTVHREEKRGKQVFLHEL